MTTVSAIFCPQCKALILEAAQCPVCQWRRPLEKGEVGKPVWAAALQATLPSKDSHPVASSHHVYFSTENGQIIALDVLEADVEKALKWRYQIGSRYRCYSVAVWEDFVLLGNEFAGGFPTPPGEFIMVNANNGQEFWRHPVEGASLSVPVTHNKIAYFTVNSGWIYAIDLEERQELWRQKLETRWSWSPAAPLYTPTGLLILTSRNDNLVAFDLEHGKVAWRFSGGGWFAQTPLWMDGMIYARCWDGTLYALDGADGREVWRYKPLREFSSDPWVTEKYLYVGVKDFQGGAEEGERAYALYTLDRQSGERVGRYEVEGHIFGRPVATGEAVYFATDDKSRLVESQGTLYALSAQAQSLLWEPCVVEQRFQSDLLLVGDYIVAATRQGAVYVIPWRLGGVITETPQSYVAQGEWEKAAIAYALQGEYAQAAGVYADRLEQPLQAGQLYLHAGEYQRVVSLLGRSTGEAERTLTLKAVQAIPEGQARAQALYDIGQFLNAADIYLQMDEFEKAGDCYLEAQEWEKAQKAYSKAAAWDKWEKVTREHELWQAVVDRYLEAGDYAQAAEIQSGRGQFLEAAIYFDRAGLATEALNAYQWVDPRNLTGEAQQRMLELAEELDEFEIAFKIYKAHGRLAKAAELAETAGHYNQAIELYQEMGEFRKAAELLVKQSRYAEAASLYERARHWGRAAESLEKYVEQEVERVGGIRYLQDTEQLENQLKRAIEMYEEEADYAGETARQALFEGADRCRVSLMSLRREPLLRLSLKADRLVYNQGNAIHYTVENVGWGTARNLVLLISGNNLMEEEKFELGALGRRQKTEGVATVVPTLVGEIMLQVELLGQSKNGELRESLIQPLQVAPMPASGGAGVSLNAQIGHGAGLRNLEAPIADRGSMWSEGTSPTATGPMEAPITPEQLKRQRIDSLRRQLVKHYSVLNILEEQSADYPAGQAPVELQVRINNTQEKIDEIETTLEELEAD